MTKPVHRSPLLRMVSTGLRQTKRVRRLVEQGFKVERALGRMERNACAMIALDPESPAGLRYAISLLTTVAEVQGYPKPELEAEGRAKCFAVCLRADPFWSPVGPVQMPFRQVNAPLPRITLPPLPWRFVRVDDLHDPIDLRAFQAAVYVHLSPPLGRAGSIRSHAAHQRRVIVLSAIRGKGADLPDDWLAAREAQTIIDRFAQSHTLWSVAGKVTRMRPPSLLKATRAVCGTGLRELTDSETHELLRRRDRLVHRRSRSEGTKA